MAPWRHLLRRILGSGRGQWPGRGMPSCRGSLLRLLQVNQQEAWARTVEA